MPNSRMNSAISTQGNQLNSLASLNSSIQHLNFRDVSIGSLTEGSSKRYDARPVLENTYRTEPKARFPVNPVRKIIQEVVENFLPEDGSADQIMKNGQITKDISNTIKNRVKIIPEVDRFKICVHVMMGENTLGSLNCSSRCLWYDEYDNFAQHSHQSQHVCVVVTVYGVYCD